MLRISYFCWSKVGESRREALCFLIVYIVIFLDVSFEGGD